MKVTNVLVYLGLLLTLASATPALRGDEPVDRYLVRKGEAVELKEPLVLKEIQRGSPSFAVTSWEIERDGSYRVTRGFLVKGDLVEDPESRRTGRLDSRVLEKLGRLLAQEEIRKLPNSFGRDPRSSPRKLIIAFGPEIQKTVHLRTPRTGDDDFFQTVMTTKAHDQKAAVADSEMAKAYKGFAAVASTIVRTTASDRTEKGLVVAGPIAGH